MLFLGIELEFFGCIFLKKLEHSEGIAVNYCTYTKHLRFAIKSPRLLDTSIFLLLA